MSGAGGRRPRRPPPPWLLLALPAALAAAELSWSQRSCLQDYVRRQDAFFEMSGAQVTGKPVFDSGDTEDSWMARRFDLAETQLFGCEALGGRYWDMTFHTGHYIDSLQLGGYSCEGWNAEAMGATCEDWRTDWNFRWSQLPDRIDGAFCAPTNCSELSLRRLVLPRYLARVLHMEFRIPPPEDADMEMRELSHWSRFKLDFVIAGLCSCGTTSLYRNLAKNPDIDFTLAEDIKEDGSFFRHNRVLPYADEVAAFNNLWRATGRLEPRLRGSDHPEYFRWARQREALRRFPGLKVIIVVCDPVNRFEKSFWRYFMCRPGADLAGTPLNPDGSHCCWDGAAAALEEPLLLERWEFGHQLRYAHATFGDRFHILHQEDLRNDPVAAYGRITSFLGARPFAPSARFTRENSVRGERSGLCRDPGLVAALQAKLEPEYTAIEAVLRARGEEPPEALRLRRTRCDRPDEARGPTPEFA